MRWQTAARVAIAAAGIGTAVALVVLSRDRPQATRPPVSTEMDPDATLQAGRGTDQRFRGNERDGEIAYEKFLQYPDGRFSWTKARLTLADGASLSADLIESKGRPSADDEGAEYTLTGNVFFRSPEGAVFEGGSATYNNGSGLATMDGPVKFSRGRMNGTGKGATYERDTGVFKILAEPVVTAEPDGQGKGRLEATSRTMAFMSNGKSMLFDGTARIGRGSETLLADRATLYLNDDQQTFRVIELRGKSQVVPAEGGSDVPSMRAENIDLGFYPETQAFERAILNGAGRVVLTGGNGNRSIDGQQINLSAAPDGKTLTRLDARDQVVVRTPASATTPARTICAASLASSGDDRNGLTAAVFSGGVEFVESRTTPNCGGASANNRTGTSDALTLVIKGQLDVIEEAQFQRNVRFKDGNVTGDADLAQYQVTKGVLELRPVGPNSRRLPHVTDGSVTVDASEIITIQLSTHDLIAKRDVKTVRAGGGDGKTQREGVFNDRELMYGFSQELQYTSATKDAVYLGAPARLQQGESMVAGRRVTITNNGADIVAEGETESVFRLDPGSARPGDAGSRPALHNVKAEVFRYADATRTATYTGNPAILTSPEGETRAQRIVLTLQKDVRRLDRLEATGAVRSRFQGDREAVGDSLLYEAAAQRYTLRGKPVALRTKEKDGTCKESRGAVAHFDRINEVPEWRPDENPGGTKNADVACGSPLNP